MSGNLIWRITKGTGGNAGANNMLAGLQAGRTVDIPFNRVSVAWRSTEPYASSVATGSNGMRFYVRNQTLNIKTTSSNGNNDWGFLGNTSSNAFDISKAELIDNSGYGRVLYSISA